ncbi:MAG: hypothetical protein PF961_10535 [Planctomycetota bacterium]|jgi:hypothetical protein|nr:hypothetical protein [Planctomycetota bacterium]
MGIRLSIPAWLRAIFCVVALLGGAATMAPNLNAAVQDDVTTAVDDAVAAADTSGSAMAPILDEGNAIGRWVVMILWLLVPLILFGSLIAWGVIQARGNEAAAARKTFIAVGIGVIFYFGVLTIFFN